MQEQTKVARFEQAVLPHLNAAYNLARWLTRNDQDAEDVVQEAYLRAFKFFDGYRGGDSGACETDNPERLAMQHADAQVLREALEALPVEFREVIVLRDLEGLSYKEIAAVAAVPLGTVMSRLARARQRLQLWLAPRMSKER